LWIQRAGKIKESSDALGPLRMVLSRQMSKILSIYDNA
jgi:hypothetical protein